MKDQAGQQHDLRIDIFCEARDVTQFAKDGLTHVTGVISAKPWANDCAVTGTLLIKLGKDPKIQYDLSFDGEDGESYRLFGAKHPSILSPLKSMTYLEVTLDSTGFEEKTVAKGELRFDMKTLLPFATSWTLKNPEKKSVLTLTPASRELLRALATSVITPGGRVPVVDEQSFQAIEKFVSQLPSRFHNLFVTGLRTLDLHAISRTTRSFRQLSLRKRQKMVSKLHGNTLFRYLIDALAMPIKIAHFEREDFQKRVGIPALESPPIKEQPPKWWKQVLRPNDLEDRTALPCDVVVIGSGAGGAAVAASLAEQGMAVAIVEQGPFLQRHHFHGQAQKRMQQSYIHGGIQPTLGNNILNIPTGRCVGGTTTINSGTCLRTPEKVLQQWQARGIELSLKTLNPYFDRVERELQVGSAQKDWLGAMGTRIPHGLGQFDPAIKDLTQGPLTRNAPDCDGQGMCIFGCPSNAKRSAEVTWIPRALRAGATLFSEMKVVKMLQKNARTSLIIAEGKDDEGKTRSLFLQPKVVIVAAGSLASPLMLRDAGIHLPRLGRGLSIHPALGVYGLYNQSLGEPWRTIPQGYGFHANSISPDLRFEGIYVTPGMLAAALDLSCESLTRWMDAWARIGQFGFMVRDENTGSVSRDRFGETLIRYSLSKRSISLLAKGSGILSEVMIRSGATEVMTNILHVGAIRSVHDAQKLAQAKLKARDVRAMGFHPLGTCAMGANAKSGVVNSDHLVFGSENLYVVDGSTVPSSLGVNPQVTIMAMALRAADRIAKHLD